MAGPPSLDEFDGSDRVRPGFPSYLDTDVADEHRQQLLTSTAGHSVAARWLRSIGYDRATQQMVAKWRHNNGWAPE